MRTTPSPLLALQQARRHLLEHGHCPTGLVDERLARSWGRSMAAGLAPTGRAMADLPSPGDLRQAMAGNHSLLSHSRPIMEYLFDQVRHSHSVVVLADRAGMLMHTLGSPGFIDKAERVALTCGASWHEAHRGTNAIGTALAEGNAVEVHGGEHFLERNSFLTCAASPILSATGELLGILDISGDHRNGHAHTLGLVSTAARMIENRLLVATCKRNIRLHLHREPEGIGSVAEGIVAVSADGWIVGANRVGLTQLGLHAGDVGATPLARCWTCGWMTCYRTSTAAPSSPRPCGCCGLRGIRGPAVCPGADWTPPPGLPCTSPLPTQRCGRARRRTGPAGHRRRPLARRCRQGPPRGGQAHPGAHPGRIGRGQGGVCPRPARQRPTVRRAFCGHQLRRHPREPHRIRAVWPCGRCVHRRTQGGPPRPPARGPWRHAVPR
jgi:hypothetical protein